MTNTTYRAYFEEDLLPLSALQHYIFCMRQCALIHVEQVWSDLFTAEGRLMHDHVDTVGDISRGDVRTEYGVPLRSFRHLITSRKEDFAFQERNRRPPMDRVNCLLSFLYTLLMHDIRSALETSGLDPAVGFLHRDRPGRYGLALDMMEEFRPFIADRLTLSLINLSQVRKQGFDTKENGAVLMDDETRKTVLVAYQKRKQDELEQPFLKEKVSVGLLYHIQAMLLARHLRGDLDVYPPFIWK